MGLNWKVLALGLGLTAPLVGILATGFGKEVRGVSNNLEGRTAPVFTMEVLGDSDQKVDLASLKGKPVVLNFWATWCQPCKIEHPHLMKAAEDYTRRGVAFYGVLYSDEPDNAARFLDREGHAFPVLYDPAQRVAIDYGVTGVPETFVIDRSGNIVHKFSGPLSYGALAQVLEPLL
jgi:cytochrome c biogenesis protein CcmG/thiol:disulfide interchange protein DsbE